MRSDNLSIRLALSLVIFVAILVVAVPLARAGGPLLVLNGQATKWPNTEVRGGPLNSATVDAQGRVQYRVDSGPLGPLTNEQATAFVDRIFDLYTDIPTASIEFVNAGRILHPATTQPIDVTGSNFGLVANSNNPTFQNPIVFDSDGSITGGSDVLGFFAFLQIDAASNSVREGIVVLNGASLTGVDAISQTSFLGVFTHEFGHFAGPLDHAQINGHYADVFSDASLPGFTKAQAYDLFAPFIETVYPFILPRPPVAQSDFEDTGFFVATLDMDTQNALSNLYPTDDYLATRGSIEGRVVIRTASGDILVNGINVVARRLDQGGVYPPPLGTAAFTNPPALDEDGVPDPPQAQAVTDPLATAASAVTGLDFGNGAYKIQGLPPGQYLVEIQQIIEDATGGSGIGPLSNQFPLLAEEFYNGERESNNDSPTDFELVTVTAGSVTTSIDIVLNGFSNAAVTLANEVEQNHKQKKAQRLNIPVELTGAAASTDKSLVLVDLGGGDMDRVEDLYRITVTTAARIYIILEPVSGQGDLDLYLFASNVKKKTSLNDVRLLNASLSAASTELIGTTSALQPGEYLIGVSAFSGSQSYRLKVIAVQ